MGTEMPVGERGGRSEELLFLTPSTIDGGKGGAGGTVVTGSTEQGGEGGGGGGWCEGGTELFDPGGREDGACVWKGSDVGRLKVDLRKG